MEAASLGFRSSRERREPLGPGASSVYLADCRKPLATLRWRDEHQETELASLAAPPL